MLERALGRMLVLALLLGGLYWTPAAGTSTVSSSTGLVSPTDALQLPMTVISMSTHDHPSLTKYWWRQVIPSFFERHMNRLNVTLQEPYDDHTQCRPRYFALIHNHQKGHEKFLRGGTGLVKHTYENHEAEMTCYYKTNFGTYMFPTQEDRTPDSKGHSSSGSSSSKSKKAKVGVGKVDEEGFIALTIYCPIWEKDVHHVSFCEHLSSGLVTSDLVLLPTSRSGAHLPTATVHKKTEPANISNASSNSPSGIWNNNSDVSGRRRSGSGDEDGNERIPRYLSFAALRSSFSEILRSSVTSLAGAVVVSTTSATSTTSHNSSNGDGSKYAPSSSSSSLPLTVCTVQTYLSPVSGPMLWLFSQYYHLIGFRVVIYDRYGRHEEYLRELIAGGIVLYHPYTAFELARPDIYTAERASQEGTEYKMYYDRENPKLASANSAGAEPQGVYAVANNTQQQDRDKMYTLDSARLQYGASSRIFLAVDCDEFLVPEGREFTLQGFRKDLLKKVFSPQALHSQEEMFLIRRSVPGQTLNPVINISDKLEHVKNFHRLSKCLLEGYSNRSIVAMSSCYGSYSVMYDRFGKYIDTRQTCSFHHLHDACNRPRSPPPKSYTPYSVTHLAAKHIGGSSSDCFCAKKKSQYNRLFLAHLNHNHFMTCFRKPRHPKEFVQQGPNSLTLALANAVKKP